MREWSTNFPLDFRFLTDIRSSAAERWAYQTTGFQPNTLESLHGPMTLGKGAKETALPFSKCQHATRGGMPRLWTLVTWQQLTPSTSPSCQINVCRLELLQSWAEYYNQVVSFSVWDFHFSKLLWFFPSLPLWCEGHSKDRALGAGSYLTSNPSVNEVSPLSPQLLSIFLKYM